ncbi:nuclear transport factor 2 family protein [Flavobacterium circumlabens]|uniref:Ketosteroid isomerase-like protein n=1 Tax=Flavobacterium circumlabens TaxID=2133765 RepID=A0A4Y7U9J5_9FLAO|nr:nuclear transport factor 2 family protein [Flavobacterium circumlabens]TCN55647.1 ketosteroid isomerase-like protein [Flavobacterium circumlabens]TEB42954.1 nuclear transport factor 2 family protein [Flavobacterium circumlabens]
MSTKTAKELLVGYLENINNPDTVIELFADDAAIELPYLKSLGMPWQMKGKDVLLEFLQNLPNMFPGFKFENVQILIDTPDQVFGEYDVHCINGITGLPYNQSYMGRLVADNGKIKLLREALNMAEVTKSFFPEAANHLPFQ